MAYETGTATDHNDLWDKLLAFLTANADLVYDGQEWSVAWSKESDLSQGLVLSGPGLAGTDSVYVGMRMTANVADDAAEIELVGMTGVIPSSTSFNDHVNVSPNSVRLLMRTQAMDYWFSATGRRFVVMVRVSTVYESIYAGLMLPYSTPSQYPYPLFIGGCAPGGGDNGVPGTWRSTKEGHAHYTKSVKNTNPTNLHDSNAWLISPSGDWLSMGVNSVSDAIVGPAYFGTGFGIERDPTVYNYGYGSILDRVIPAFGDGHVLTPVSLLQQYPTDQSFGVLDGVYRIGGRGNAPENTVVIDGVTYVVGTNTFRTDIGDFWAMELGVVP